MILKFYIHFTCGNDLLLINQIIVTNVWTYRIQYFKCTSLMDQMNSYLLK